jgi:thioredoxin-like negative regulator of GroEL
MRTLTDQERWVLAVGDVVDEIVDIAEAEFEAEVVRRLPHAVLVRTTHRRASELRRLPNAIIRVFETEYAGQRALGLFET